MESGPPEVLLWHSVAQRIVVVLATLGSSSWLVVCLGTYGIGTYGISQGGRLEFSCAFLAERQGSAAGYRQRPFDFKVEVVIIMTFSTRSG